MWRRLANKISTYLTCSVNATALKVVMVEVERERDRLDTVCGELLTSNYNLQEEVFGLRDELAAFAKLANVDFIHDLENGLSVCPVEAPSEIIGDVRTEMGSRYHKKRVDAAGRALAIAIESSHRWEEHLKLSYKNLKQEQHK